MKLSSVFLTPLFLLISTLGAAGAFAQPPFQLSSKFYEIDLSRAKFWDGAHRFDNVLCLTFPRSLDAEALAYALYNKNTLYFSRAAYKEQTAVYVVASTVPAGRSSEVEIADLTAQGQQAAEANPAYFKQMQSTGLLGPSLILIVRNSLEGAKESPFPFARAVAIRPDGQLTSLSVHRLFVRGSDRIEVAGLRYFKEPLGPDREAEAISDLSSFVQTAADSLQSCTAKLPARAP